LKVMPRVRIDIVVRGVEVSNHRCGWRFGSSSITLSKFYPTLEDDVRCTTCKVLADDNAKFQKHSARMLFVGSGDLNTRRSTLLKDCTHEMCSAHCAKKA
jgi:hypothetical protein